MNGEIKMNDLVAEVEAEQEQEAASGDSPVLTNNQAAAWINEGDSGPYLTVQVATGRFNLFPNTDAAEKALEYLAKAGEGAE